MRRLLITLFTLAAIAATGCGPADHDVNGCLAEYSVPAHTSRGAQSAASACGSLAKSSNDAAYKKQLRCALPKFRDARSDVGVQAAWRACT